MEKLARGRALVEKLSSEQLVELLETTFRSLDRGAVSRLCGRLDQDIARTVESILERPRDGSGRASQGRLLELWGRLADRWWEAIESASDGEGPYISQDNTWDPPYFSGDDLSARLEAIALDMAPVLEQLNPGDIQDDLSGTCLELESNIQALPEWIGAECGDPVQLGIEATSILLRLKWCSSPDALDWCHQVSALQSQSELVDLCPAAFPRFSAGLAQDERKSLHDALEALASEGITALVEPGSPWFQMRREACREIDQAAYLAYCRRSIPLEWEAALPLVEFLSSEGRFEEADAVALEAWSALFREGAAPPEEGLLRLPWGQSAVPVAHLVRLWMCVAQSLGAVARHSGLCVQLAYLESGSDWDVMATTFAGLENHQIGAHLLGDWKNRVATGHGEATPWVGWLLDDGLEGRRRFLDRITAWLHSLGRDRQSMMSASSGLMLLTADVFGESLQSHFPRLEERIRWTGCPAAGEHTKSRRDWLARCGAEALREPVRRCWEAGIVWLVPDPGSSRKSRYDTHAAWMSAAYELNPRAAGVLLQEWRSRHSRKINLWSALGSQEGIREQLLTRL